MGERVHIDDDGDRLTVAIPSRREWSVIAFFILWLVGWLATTIGVERVLVGIIVSLWSGQPPPHTWPMAAFLLGFWLFWSIGGWVARKSLYWMLFGRETIVVDDQHVAIIRRVGGRETCRRYATASITNLQPSVHVYLEPDSHTPSALALDTLGRVQFDVEGRTVRCGPGLDEEERQRVLLAIQRRLDARASSTSNQWESIAHAPPSAR